MGDSAQSRPITPRKCQLHIWALAAARWAAEKSQARAHEVFWTTAGPTQVCYQSRPHRGSTDCSSRCSFDGSSRPQLATFRDQSSPLGMAVCPPDVVRRTRAALLVMVALVTQAAHA